MTTVFMKEFLARARAKKALDEEIVAIDIRAKLLAKPAAIPAPAISPTIGVSAIAALRERLKLTSIKESVRATESGHKTGTLPVDEVIEVSIEHVTKDTLPAHTSTTTGMHGETISYNTEQQTFVDLVASGQSGVLIGAAGTGKTTCSKGAVTALIESGKVPVLKADGHKHLVDGSIGILIISYTRRAVNNIRKVQSEDLKNNCITSHKLLEYAPDYFDIQDPETGLFRKTMQFIATRNASNPLPDTIYTIIVEEASMLSVEFHAEILAAITHKVQWLFIGDIQQLPPVFGSAILGFKMLELTVVELIQVYRQALESPIIRLAHRVLSGKPIPVTEYADWKVKDQLTIHPWKKKLSADNAALTLAAFFRGAVDSGVYTPEHDIILIPYNKACGTIELNNQIANHLARKRNAMTYEVMAGFNKYYFSVGDRVLYDREDAEIIEITPNPVYTGAKVQPPSVTLDYWGHNPNLMNESAHDTYMEGDDIDMLLAQVASTEERVTQSSHRIVVRLMDTAQELTVNKASEVNALLLAYALTVHKAQGSEWRKVFFCLHHSHATMMQRELLYTGITRAREELYVICEPETFTKGILSQKIKGNTLAEKAEFFKGKAASLIRNRG
jgi:exodeoxyribonuclease V alpha subunit